MKNLICVTLSSLQLLWAGYAVAAGCAIRSDGASPESSQRDDAFERLASKAGRCPRDVIDLRNMLGMSEAKLTTTMVGNRGFHNPRAGSFSFFEMVEIPSSSALGVPVSTDQWMFGHFTTPVGTDSLDLDQGSAAGALMIEMIAWDFKKEVYNFYELIGQGSAGQWYYRGDSADIWADTKNLHFPTGEGTNSFGNRLRCSGCHITGGPIMKELEVPNDSWWTKDRPLKFGDRKPVGQMRAVLNNISDAADLSSSVKSGVGRLLSGKAFQKHVMESPKAALKPLFCPKEINLASSSDTIDNNGNGTFGVPSAFFVDPTLSSPGPLGYSRDAYLATLSNLGSIFPETDLADADHSWLVPVKAWSDQATIQQLVNMGLITDEFVRDVLAIDMTRPIFSNARCALLRHLPKAWSVTWLDEFKANLARGHGKWEAELLQNFQDPGRTQAFHSKRAATLLANCAKRLDTPGDYADLVEYAGQVRNEIKVSDISSNPRGQILEPGFRVIFPKWDFAYEPFSKTMDDTCLTQTAKP